MADIDKAIPAAMAALNEKCFQLQAENKRLKDIIKAKIPSVPLPDEILVAGTGKTISKEEAEKVLRNNHGVNFVKDGLKRL